MAISNICVTVQRMQHNKLGVIKYIPIPFNLLNLSLIWNNLRCCLLSVFHITEVVSLSLRRMKILSRHLLNAVNLAEELQLKDSIPCLFCVVQQWRLPPEWVLAACRSGGYEVPFSYVVLSAVTFPFRGLCSICISNKKMSSSMWWILIIWLHPTLKDIHRNHCIFLAGPEKQYCMGLFLVCIGNCI